MRKKPFFFRLAFIIPLITSAPAIFSQQPALDSIFSRAKIAGAQLVVSDKGKEQAYYYGKPAAGEPGNVNGNTVFQAASLSKVILAYIVMRMVDKKMMALDTPLCKYYTYDRTRNDPAAQQITARMLLHHTSGFPNWAANPVSKEWAGSVLSTSFPPGSSWLYSGEGFMYLQFAVESIYKASLEKIAHDEVFQPLHMFSSSFLWRPSFDMDGAWGHDKQGNQTTRPEAFLPAAAYSLLTTAGDYNHFLQAVMNGTGLNAATHRLMLGDTVRVQKTDRMWNDTLRHINWALGLGIQQNEDGVSIWHWGDNGDYTSFFMAFPAQQKSMVYFANSANGLTVMNSLLDFCFGKKTWWAIHWLNSD
jgi:CubicO group peptidase (beta-lactamase class C family)